MNKTVAAILGFFLRTPIALSRSTLIQSHIPLITNKFHCKKSIFSFSAMLLVGDLKSPKTDFSRELLEQKFGFRLILQRRGRLPRQGNRRRPVRNLGPHVSADQNRDQLCDLRHRRKELRVAVAEIDKRDRYTSSRPFRKMAEPRFPGHRRPALMHG